jgi:hypothetical protein
MKTVLVRLGLAAASLALLVVAFFVTVYVLRPRVILRSFHAFVARHPVGSPIAALVDDPFVDSATTATGPAGEAPTVEFGRERPARLAKLRADAKAAAKGRLDLTWTHTPPFGRISAVVDFEGGKVTAVRVSELD